jgi:transposase
MAMLAERVEASPGSTPTATPWPLQRSRPSAGSPLRPRPGPTPRATGPRATSPTSRSRAGAAGRSRVLAATGLGWPAACSEHDEWVVEGCRPKRPASRTGAKTDAADAVRAANQALAPERLAAPRQRGASGGAAGAAGHPTGCRCRPGGRHQPAPEALIVGHLRGCAPGCAADRRPSRSAPAPPSATGRPGRLSIGRPSAPYGPPRERIGLLQAEADEFHTEIAALVHAAAPWLPELPGVGPISAAQVLVSWSHAGRLRSEAAFATLAGVSPIPASSGQYAQVA